MQARIYRRMGKLYEKHNQLHALGYYEQAEAFFSQSHPEFVTLLKDRGWLHILRQSWPQAETDLRRAIALAPHSQRSQRADIDDALASLYRHQREFNAAIDFARRSLREREALGDLLRVGHSFNNLGLIYNELGDYDHAIADFEEAIAIFERLNNLELVAGARLNIGLAHHMGGQLAVAIQVYEASLALSRDIELPLVQARAHANLTEAFAAMEQLDAARAHWRAGLSLSLRAGFDDEVAYYRSLQTQFPALAEAGSPSLVATPQPQPVSAQAHEQGLPLDLDPESQAILARAQAGEKVTPRWVMEELGVSKATATRRLATLVEQGILTRYGEGRGVHYAYASAPANGAHGSLTHATPDLSLPANVGERLARHGPALALEFDLVALGVDPTEGQRWYGAFRAWPDVPTFFRLEARLGEVLGTRVNLKPYTEPIAPSMSADPAPDAIVWVWRTQPERSIMN
jgi:tetratricopeptide (TPR) repeat protein